MTQQDDQKRIAAEAAVADIADGMVVGLGTGSTIFFALEALGRRVAAGARILGIPTSEASAAHAKRLGIPLTDLGSHPRIDLTIDGADEVRDGGFDLIKGLGGALLREKIVAASSNALTIVIDETKRVPRLGARVRLPVEIVAFGHTATLDRLAEAGVYPRLRTTPEGTPFLTDGGNLVADCAIGPQDDPQSLHSRLKGLIGVVETGFFLGMATKVIIGTQGGPLVRGR